MEPIAPKIGESVAIPTVPVRSILCRAARSRSLLASRPGRKRGLVIEEPGRGPKDAARSSGGSGDQKLRMTAIVRAGTRECREAAERFPFQRPVVGWD